MSAYESYLSAVVPTPFTVLGRKLKPFSIGHQILLDKFESNYSLSSTGTPGYPDLLLSVFICSRTFEECLADLSSKLCAIRLRAWGWYCGNFDVSEAKQYFRAYIQAHSQWPKRFWILREGKQEASGAPFIQSLKVRLRKDLGYTESEAMNAPYSMALWNYLTNLENSGVVRMFDDSDEAILKASEDPELAKQIDAIAAAVRKREASK